MCGGKEVPLFRPGESAEEDILAALRGFCLFIFYGHTVGLPACRQAGRQNLSAFGGETVRDLFPASSEGLMFEIYE